MPYCENNWVDPALGFSVESGYAAYFPNPRLSDFADCDCQVSIVVTEEIWTAVQEAAGQRSATGSAVVRSVLFESLYGIQAYKALLRHLHATETPAVNAIDDTGIRRSTRRETHVDLVHAGKADTPRSMQIPSRMLEDLKIVARGEGIELSLLVRILMFRYVAGKARADRWLAARASVIAAGKRAPHTPGR